MPARDIFTAFFLGLIIFLAGVRIGIEIERVRASIPLSELLSVPEWSDEAQDDKRPELGPGRRLLWMDCGARC